MKKKYLIFIILFLVSISFAKSGDILDGVDYDFTNYTEVSGCKFRMWAPPTCNYVRGVLLAYNQMQEITALDAEIRKACMIEDLAIIWADNLMSIGNGTATFDKLQQALNQLAELSGMPEIATAPFASIAHSTAGISVREIAIAKPERCFGIIQLNAVDYRENEAVKDIPWISIKNGLEETGDTWEHARYYMINDNAKDPVLDNKEWSSPRGNGCRISLISLINGRHFGWSPFVAKLIAAFIQKAAHYQIAADGQEITRIPENQGWLTDTATVATPQYAAAAYDDYKGDRSKAFWHLDEEFAKMWVEMHLEEAAKQAQTVSLTTFNSGPSQVWQQQSGAFNLNNGGMTTPYPHNATSSVAANPIKVKTYNGAFKVVNGTDLYFSPARYFFVDSQGRDWLTFYQEGTDTERYAEITTARITASNPPAAETITADVVADQSITTETVPYNVTGSSNIDDWVVSGLVSKWGSNWQINNYTSVPKSQVYIRHAANLPSSLKETKFTIINDRPAQTLAFDETMPTELEQGSVDPITLIANASVSGSTVNYYLLSGPATLNENILLPSGKAGVITVMAIARNDANNPAKAILNIEVKGNTGLKPYVVEPISVFPNPVEDVLNVKAPAGVKLQLKDLTGRIILTAFADEEITSISVSSIPAGIYLLSLDNITTVKAVKK